MGRFWNQFGTTVGTTKTAAQASAFSRSICVRRFSSRSNGFDTVVKKLVTARASSDVGALQKRPLRLI